MLVRLSSLALKGQEQHPDYCQACAVSGGYCGMCHGGYWTAYVTQPDPEPVGTAA